MKHTKKLLSVFLSFVMLFSITAGIDLTALATSKTQNDAVNWANSQIGKSLDYDGVYGAQCVDLTKYYYKFLGVSPVNGNGCDYATNSLPSGWQRIKYYSGFTPQPGDVAVWTYASSSYGHVAIITSANSSTMNVVEQNGSTHITRSHTYNYSYGTFYGVIRPNFTSSSSGAVGQMTTPTIHIDANVYYTGSNVRITWDATSANTDFYQYWLVIKNTTNNKEYYGGATGKAGDVSSNHYDFKIPVSGTYYITVYAVPYNNKDSRQKVATKTFKATTNEMTTPTISTNSSQYHKGDTVSISWQATSTNTDFYQYWVIIKNTTLNKLYYSGSAGSDNNPSKNNYRFTIPAAGDYQIVVYSVPYYNKDKRQKAATKTFTAYEEHKYDNGKITKNATCLSTGIKTYTCTVCKTTKTETIPTTGHTYKDTVTKATLSKNGKIVNKCTVCGDVTKTTTVYYPKTVKLSKNAFTVNGKVQKPSVVVKDSKGNTLTLNKDYTVNYSNANSKNVGKYTVTIKFKGNYSGTKTIGYCINPKGTEFLASNKGGFKAISKGFTLKWNKQNSQTTGYQIQYATKKDFSNAATITIANPNTTSKTIKGRASNTRYYVRVRTYKKIGTGTFYSNWNSGTKSVVTLK